ncbi:Inositol 1,4,5-trisphosphate receptor-interacting protein-like 1, partial [Charadrius vociferus]
VVEDLVDDLLAVLQENLATSFFPVLHPAIGVGSTFEGWSPREYDAVYRLLVPLKPPHGHTFHLELGTARQTPEKNSRIRVELECTCMRDQLVENRLCFLHHPQEELRRNPAASLLGTLCTGSYLDAVKTAQWFQNLVRSAWREEPPSRLYSMKLLPSSRSCKLQLTNDSGRNLFIEMVFGVQQGDSDIFLSSHTTEDTIPSTMWAESYAVAEVKFFRHIATQAPHDTFHLKCLQLYAGILVDTGISSYILKTVAMHLLNTIPLANWSRTEFLMRLEDILQYLHSCLEDKRLDHFFFGNENIPEDIILPPDFQTAEPINLLQHLVEDQAAHARAVCEFNEIQD